jgi:integrase
VTRGRVYRRCGCRDENGRQLGQRCPELTENGKHGTWCYAIDLPRGRGDRRKTMRRSGFATKRAASKALDDVLDRIDEHVVVDDEETVADYLTAWIEYQRHALAPSTLHTYRRHVERDLIPALGDRRLEHLRHQHVAAFVRDLEEAGRGVTTIRRLHATLSSALGDAVKRKRLSHNAAAFVVLPRPTKVERNPWTATEAVTFLEHASGDRLGQLFEVLAGTGLRIGECLALRRDDIDLDARALYVHPARGNLTSVNGHLSFTAPKTKGSAAGVGLSARVVAAFERQLARIDAERAEWGEAYQDLRLLFPLEDGRPMRLEHVRRRLHALSDQAGVRRCRVHDLRHLAATLMLTAGVPLPIVSKALRHSQVAITSDLYGHLTREAATAAADGLGATLDAAAAERAAERSARDDRPDATTVRPHDRSPSR